MSSLTFDKLNQILLEIEENISDYSCFFESGTLEGQTILFLNNYFKKLYTIEITEKYFNYFDSLKKDLKIENVENYFGDSTDITPIILKKIRKNNKCIFWLDGHWSSGDTGKGIKDNPLIEECLSINDLYKSNKAIILIDDYRLFGTKISEDWEEITEENIKKCFTNFSIINEIVIDDVYVLVIEK
jgi:hypothetical protein